MFISTDKETVSEPNILHRELDFLNVDFVLLDLNDFFDRIFDIYNTGVFAKLVRVLIEPVIACRRLRK